LIYVEQKQKALLLIEEACCSGARKSKACEIIGIDIRTAQRWQNIGIEDRRRGSFKKPANKLSELERAEIIELLSSAEYRDLSPAQVVPRLADLGRYLASEATMYRILKEQKMKRHRSASKPRVSKKPQELVADGPNQVWSWDITYLPLVIKGFFVYLYMVMDLYSRKIVAWQIYDTQSSELAADLMTEACLLESVDKGQVCLHSDNGTPMKGASLLARLQELGVIPSFSRPSVSNDNPYSEALFKTLKYRPEYPDRAFENIGQSRQWVEGFVTWYNREHLHSGIRFVSPNDRHEGRDIEILQNRHLVYSEAQQKNPLRWTIKTRDWNPPATVWLNKSHKRHLPSDQYKKAA
jgi:transposase InsO family protein